MGFHTLGPFQISETLVKCLLGDWLSKDDVECFIVLFVHFIHEIKHFNVCFNPDFIPETREIIKPVRVTAVDMAWYDVALVLTGFCNKALFPFKVADATGLLTRT